MGLILIIVLIIQLFTQKEQALLRVNESLRWPTPWDGWATAEVLVFGFFVISQFVVPFITAIGFNLVGVNLATNEIRTQAFSILVNYSLMAIGGLAFIYYYLKPYGQLPEEWFPFKLNFKGLAWGVAGYLVALPIVVVVSLLNQQLWSGQGGSNVLLFLALQAQDWVVLGIFFFTASIAAPIFEEIVFRGFLLSALTKHLPVTGAIGVSSLIFSIAHLSLSEILPLTALGAVLGLVYTRSRNLLASMVLHSIWNGGTLISLFVLGSGNT
ncbi:MAG: CPBP family intramembrane metalloprotease [Synechococcaceae cyanobacterium RL_1_2]|nr:CPBP family intramembrane metalloprotease [Synechococcaceae cyanobacterium RL_1_2]